MSFDCTQLETLIRNDPAGRGVASFRRNGRLLAEGELAAAAESVVASSAAVGIVTGFCVFTPTGVVAETDGPPGALFLANVLSELGGEVRLISDAYGAPLLQAGCDFYQMPRSIIIDFPFEPGGPQSPARAGNGDEHNEFSDHFADEFLAGEFGRRMTHLIAIERAGPSHTLESAAASEAADPAETARFQNECPLETRNVCCNMRGESINANTAKIHRLFERAAEGERRITTIGVGDGGNEIGMGKLPWSDLAAASGSGGKIACRVPTRHLILSGVSNWGGYALAAAVARLRGKERMLQTAGEDRIGRLIERLVRETDCVDGLTKRREATVDGLPLAEYRETTAAICLAAQRDFA